jgi:hypothetical protein
VTGDGVVVIFIARTPLRAGTAFRRFTEFENEALESRTFVADGFVVTAMPS